jgi:hypothetical protein
MLVTIVCHKMGFPPNRYRSAGNLTNYFSTDYHQGKKCEAGLEGRMFSGVVEFLQIQSS